MYWAIEKRAGLDYIYIDKWLWVISTIMIFKNSKGAKELKGTKNKAILNLKQ